jgi:hypothetical protein
MSLIIFGIAPLLALPVAVHANSFTNGGFEATTHGAGQLGFDTAATGWSTAGYNFLFAPGTGDSSGSPGQYGNLNLWGPNSGAANGFTDSPSGGNFLAADGAYLVEPLSQTIVGLLVGHTYTVGFDWAGAQQNGFTGPQTEQWEVSLGRAAPRFTAIYSNPSHGFSGWMHESFTFVADSGADTLSFLAHGTPDGVPPFSLLDGVTFSQEGAVPEPSTWTLMLVGVGGLGAMARRGRARSAIVGGTPED